MVPALTTGEGWAGTLAQPDHGRVITEVAGHARRVYTIRQGVPRGTRATIDVDIAAEEIDGLLQDQVVFDDGGGPGLLIDPKVGSRMGAIEGVVDDGLAGDHPDAVPHEHIIIDQIAGTIGPNARPLIVIDERIADDAVGRIPLHAMAIVMMNTAPVNQVARSPHIKAMAIARAHLPRRLVADIGAARGVRAVMPGMMDMEIDELPVRRRCLESLVPEHF